MSTITIDHSEKGQLRRHIAPVLVNGKKGKIARRMAKRLGGDTPDHQWQAWVEYLSARKQPSVPRKLVVGNTKKSPLLWSMNSLEGVPSSTIELINKLTRLKRPREIDQKPGLAQRLATWLDESTDRDPDCGYALECLAWSHALPWLAARLPATLWWQLLENLLVICDESVAVDSREKVLTCQLFSAELPLTLAYLFPELNPCRQRSNTACKLVSDGLVDLLDGEGLPHSEHLSLLRPLWASWTRTMMLVGQPKATKISGAATDQFDFLIEQALRLSRADGSQVFGKGTGRQSAIDEDFLNTAIQLADDPQTRTLASLLVPSKAKTISASHPDLPDSPANNAEWSQLGMLRANWTPHAPFLVVTYDNKTLRSELNSGGQTIWSGNWQPEIAVDDQRLEPDSHWETVCWVSDDDADYLELEMACSRGWRLQRQMLLARRDYIFYVADALVGQTEGNIDYRCRFPVTGDVRLTPQEDTRDGVLMGKKRLAQVMPLALPEWRIETRVGELTSSSHGIELRQAGQGKALYAPLLFDLHPQRQRKSATWRQLTVAEHLQVLQPDVAVGFRVQVGKANWLFYRSLAARGNRTVLGQNTAAEFLAARFLDNGETETLVEVE